MVYSVFDCYFETEDEAIEHFNENFPNKAHEYIACQVPMDKEKFDNLPEFQGY